MDRFREIFVERSRQLILWGALGLLLIVGITASMRWALRSEPAASENHSFVGDSASAAQSEYHAFGNGQGKGSGKDNGQGNGKGNGNGTGNGNGQGQPGNGKGNGNDKPLINGAYRVLVSGYYSGEGVAAVGANSVNLNVKVISESGEKLHLKAPKLDRQGNHFSGEGTIGNSTVELIGRVEAADGTVIKLSRICAHFTSSDGHNGLMAGYRLGE